MSLAFNGSDRIFGRASFLLRYGYGYPPLYLVFLTSSTAMASAGDLHCLFPFCFSFFVLIRALVLVGTHQDGIVVAIPHHCIAIPMNGPRGVGGNGMGYHKCILALLFGMAPQVRKSLPRLAGGFRAGPGWPNRVIRRELACSRKGHGETCRGQSFVEGQLRRHCQGHGHGQGTRTYVQV
jgi:hypothetical protein